MVYDGFGRPSASVDPMGYRSTTVYDAFGRLSEAVDPLGHRTTTVYDAHGQTVATIDPLGQRTTTLYDAYGRNVGWQGANGARTTFTLDSAGRRTAVTDPDLNVTTSVYDALGRETQRTDPLGHSSTFTYRYDGLDRLSSRTDRDGRRRDFTYNAYGDKTLEVWFAPGGTIVSDRLTFTYDAVHNELTAANSAGIQTMAYDALNRVTHTDQLVGASLTFTYDAAGNRTLVQDSLGGVVTSTYDAAHQLVRRQQDAHSWVDFTYDGDGRLVTTQRFHDTLSGPASLNSAPQVVGIGINSGPNITLADTGDSWHIGGQSGEIAQILVAFNMPVTLGSGAFAVTPWALVNYTSISGATPNTTTPGLTVTAVPDTNNTLYLLTFSGAGTHDSGILLRGVYDLVITGSAVSGNGTTMSGVRTDTFATVFGGVLGSTILMDPSGNTAFVDSGSLAYLSGHIGAESTTDPGYLPAVDYDLNGYNEFTDFNWYRAQSTVNYQWTSSAASASLVAFTVNQYDAGGRLRSTTSAERYDTEISDYRYEYDDANRVTKQTIDGQSTTFTYDTAGQVLSESTLSDFGTYTYDNAGNRSTYDTTGTTNDRSYSATANQYTTDGAWNYTYDNEGNETVKAKIGSSEAWSYFYDNRNQLTKAAHTTNGSSIDLEVDYKYDANGNRVEKTSDLDGAGIGGATVTRFLLDGWNPAKPSPIGNENVAVWADLNGSSSLTTRYLWSDKIDDLLGRTESAGQFWTLTDNLGSIRTVVTNDGIAVDKITYDAYGNITSETAPTYRGRYAWTGREREIELNLQYNHARYYDPQLGRWTSLDPLGFDTGDSNLYRYVNNAPTTATDPSGQLFFALGDTSARKAAEYVGWHFQKSAIVPLGDFKGLLSEWDKTAVAGQLFYIQPIGDPVGGPRGNMGHPPI